ncbi:hypothetical protein BSQ39_10770 [Loigolactobacillus backii]|nr:hypothetical protein BSQ39_10770 [Loigolactobacillus backii]PIO88350.1 hypothetical protein B8A32_01405 [Loigolactobacillus backii]
MKEQSMADKVSCVVVTYNRLALLKRCLNAIFAQSKPVTDVFIVNNHSSDQTAAYLAQQKGPHVHVFNLNENLGGAGGFVYGMQQAAKVANDYIWLMDDDTLVHADTLAQLLRPAKKISNFGFLSPQVQLKDGTIGNQPLPLRDWQPEPKTGLTRLKTGSFVAILFNQRVVERLGLPISDFFIWFDDHEYTMRISQQYPAYYVPTAQVTHLTVAATPDILTDQKRIPRYFYLFRNKYYTQKEFRGSWGAIKDILANLVIIGQIIVGKRPKKGQKIMTVIRGTWAGLFFKPQIKSVNNEEGR